MISLKHIFRRSLRADVRPVATPDKSGHFRKAVIKSMQDMAPGLFTSDMVWIRLGSARQDFTRHDLRQMVRNWERRGYLADVGRVRQGHASVPVYVLKNGERLQ